MPAKVTVRYFAAAGIDEEIVDVAPEATVGTLMRDLGARDPELARVLSRCSLLCDGIAVRNPG